MKRIPIGLCLLMAGGLAAAQFQPNYDESRVPRYQLPDPLVTSEGTRLSGADAWWPRRQTTAPENAESDVDAVADS